MQGQKCGMAEILLSFSIKKFGVINLISKGALKFSAPLSELIGW